MLSYDWTTQSYDNILFKFKYSVEYLKLNVHKIAHNHKGVYLLDIYLYIFYNIFVNMKGANYVGFKRVYIFHMKKIFFDLYTFTWYRTMNHVNGKDLLDKPTTNVSGSNIWPNK